MVIRSKLLQLYTPKEGDSRATSSGASEDNGQGKNVPPREKNRHLAKKSPALRGTGFCPRHAGLSVVLSSELFPMLPFCERKCHCEQWHCESPSSSMNEDEVEVDKMDNSSSASGCWTMGCHIWAQWRKLRQLDIKGLALDSGGKEVALYKGGQ